MSQTFDFLYLPTRLYENIYLNHFISWNNKYKSIFVSLLRLNITLSLSATPKRLISTILLTNAIRQKQQFFCKNSTSKKVTSIPYVHLTFILILVSENVPIVKVQLTVRYSNFTIPLVILNQVIQNSLISNSSDQIRNKLKKCV